MDLTKVKSESIFFNCSLILDTMLYYNDTKNQWKSTFSAFYSYVTVSQFYTVNLGV